MVTKESILSDIREYITEKHKNKTWTAGKDFVQYAGPYFDHNEFVSAANTLLNEWLVLGNEAVEFEKSFPKLMSKKRGLVTNSGSSSNLLMISSLLSPTLYDLNSKIKLKSNGKSDKILIPSAGFPTTVNPILQCGFTPVFCDIELDTLNIDLYKAERLLERHGDIKAIMFAHVLGNPPNMDIVMKLVKKYNLILIEDVCDGLGTTYDGKALGSFGELSSCSFYPAHTITCGEGGAVSYNTLEQDRVLRSLRDWGRGCYCTGKQSGLSKVGCCGKRFSNWISALPNDVFDHKYVYTEIGYNLKPIELQCSILNEQLKKLPVILEKRVKNYKLLFDIFSKYEEYFILPRPSEKADVKWFAFPLTVKKYSPFTKNEFTMYLEDNKIQTRNYFAGNILLTDAYANFGYTKEMGMEFESSTYAMLNTFFLGVSPVITDEQIHYIGEIVDNFFKNNI